MTIEFQRYNGSEWVAESEDSGGANSNHATLTNLAWTNSKHTGTADRYAGFDSNGDAAYLGRDVDGGFSNSTYLSGQAFDGGGASG